MRLLEWIRVWRALRHTQEVVETRLCAVIEKAATPAVKEKVAERRTTRTLELRQRAAHTPPIT